MASLPHLFNPASLAGFTHPNRPPVVLSRRPAIERRAANRAAEAPRVLVVADRDLPTRFDEGLARGGLVVERPPAQSPSRMDVDGAAAVVLALDEVADACEWARVLSARGSGIAIAVLLSEVSEFDETLLLEMGADFVGPLGIEPRVMAARLRALARRRHREPAAPARPRVLDFGRLRIDALSREARLDGEVIHMSAAEFDLLWILADRAGEVLKRDDVQKKLRGAMGAESNRFVDARLYRLRQRFGDTPEVAARIRTVRPDGYLFAKVDW